MALFYKTLEGSNFLPTMSSDGDFSKAIDITKQLGTHAKRMVKPKDIPIYGEEIVIKEKAKDMGEPGVLLNTVKEARLIVQDAYNQVEENVTPVKDSAVNIIETGKAHALSTYQMIRDEQDTTINATVIGGSGLLGFALASLSKRARFFKRLIFTSISAGAASYIIYPSETEAIGTSLLDEATRLGLIAYNFVQGAQPSETVNKLTASTVSPSSVSNSISCFPITNHLE